MLNCDKKKEKKIHSSFSKSFDRPFTFGPSSLVNTEKKSAKLSTKAFVIHFKSNYFDIEDVKRSIVFFLNRLIDSSLLVA